MSSSSQLSPQPDQAYNLLEPLVRGPPAPEEPGPTSSAGPPVWVFVCECRPRDCTECSVVPPSSGWSTLASRSRRLVRAASAGCQTCRSASPAQCFVSVLPWYLEGGVPKEGTTVVSNVHRRLPLVLVQGKKTV